MKIIARITACALFIPGLCGCACYQMQVNPHPVDNVAGDFVDGVQQLSSIERPWECRGPFFVPAWIWEGDHK